MECFAFRYLRQSAKQNTEWILYCENITKTRYKKVLLRERKRHTARRVVSTPSVVLPGYPPRGGVPGQVTPPGGSGTPPGGSGYPPGGGTQSGTPPGGAGYPPRGVPSQVPPQGGYPARYPPRGGRVPPRGGPGQVPPRGGPGTPRGGFPVRYPPLPHGILGNVAKHYGIWVPPPGVDRQTKWNYYLPVVLRTRAVTKHIKTSPEKSPNDFLVKCILRLSLKVMYPLTLGL